MNIGDLVRRHSTEEISLVIDVVMGCVPSNPLMTAPWIRTSEQPLGIVFQRQNPLRFHELYEVINESR